MTNARRDLDLAGRFLIDSFILGILVAQRERHVLGMLVDGNSEATLTHEFEQRDEQTHRLDAPPPVKERPQRERVLRSDALEDVRLVQLDRRVVVLDRNVVIAQTIEIDLRERAGVGGAEVADRQVFDVKLTAFPRGFEQ